MGTHPNGPSAVKLESGDEVPLRDVLGRDLPFLFKILSVRKALSIQAHPDKILAQRLHQQFPNTYKDSNHKPEIAIALTRFEALCGFRPIEDILKMVKRYPEFASLVTPESLMALEHVQRGSESAQKAALKAFFHDLMTCGAELVKTKTEHLLARLDAPNDLEALFRRLNEEYPFEVGCFCIFIMNYVTMLPGECIFMAANEPHAYLLGECIECMALSDNVVRAGLTPKFRDVDTLCSMLTYNMYKGEEVFTQPESISSFSLQYKAPVPEFSVIKTAFSDKNSQESICRSHDTILLCIQGSVTIATQFETLICEAGNVLLLPGGVAYDVQCSASSGAQLFQAFQP
jgi:mannose-6-phosphate isomerase